MSTDGVESFAIVLQGTTQYGLRELYTSPDVRRPGKIGVLKGVKKEDFPLYSDSAQNFYFFGIPVIPLDFFLGTYPISSAVDPERNFRNSVSRIRVIPRQLCCGDSEF